MKKMLCRLRYLLLPITLLPTLFSADTVSQGKSDPKPASAVQQIPPEQVALEEKLRSLRLRYPQAMVLSTAASPMTSTQRQQRIAWLQALAALRKTAVGDAWATDRLKLEESRAWWGFDGTKSNVLDRELLASTEITDAQKLEASLRLVVYLAASSTVEEVTQFIQETVKPRLTSPQRTLALATALFRTKYRALGLEFAREIASPKTAEGRRAGVLIISQLCAEKQFEEALVLVRSAMEQAPPEAIADYFALTTSIYCLMDDTAQYDKEIKAAEDFFAAQTDTPTYHAGRERVRFYHSLMQFFQANPVKGHSRWTEWAKKIMELNDPNAQALTESTALSYANYQRSIKPSTEASLSEYVRTKRLLLATPQRKVGDRMKDAIAIWSAMAEMKLDITAAAQDALVFYKEHADALGIFHLFQIGAEAEQQRMRDLAVACYELLLATAPDDPLAIQAKFRLGQLKGNTEEGKAALAAVAADAEKAQLYELAFTSKLRLYTASKDATEQLKLKTEMLADAGKISDTPRLVRLMDNTQKLAKDAEVFPIFQALVKLVERRMDVTIAKSPNITPQRRLFEEEQMTQRLADARYYQSILARGEKIKALLDDPKLQGDPSNQITSRLASGTWDGGTNESRAKAIAMWDGILKGGKGTVQRRANIMLWAVSEICKYTPYQPTAYGWLASMEGTVPLTTFEGCNVAIYGAAAWFGQGDTARARELVNAVIKACTPIKEQWQREVASQASRVMDLIDNKVDPKSRPNFTCRLLAKVEPPKPLPEPKPVSTSKTSKEKKQTPTN